MRVDSKRIAKNASFLYIRMILLMIITFYTMRIVLRALGTEDFGLYNIVGGIVVLLSFIQSSMTVAFQRFISYELGKGNNESVNRAFKGGMTVSIIFIILIIIILESVGLWAVNKFLSIPSDKMMAANIIYQCSIFTFIFNFLRIPYQALIISHEKMSFFSIMSIVDGIIKLGIAFIILWVGNDKLIMYGILILIGAILSTICYKIYCTRIFESGRYNWYWDRSQCMKILSFSGYSMVISVANVVSQQGGNILLNLFSGLVANAAFGIANQVGGAIMSCASSFQTAFNPQIVKLHANGETQLLNTFIERTSLFSYILLLIVGVPVIFHMKWGLSLWLGEVPEYSVQFCIWIIVYQMIDALQAPLNTFIYATGTIKKYSIWLSGLLVLNLPLSAVLLLLGFSPVWVLIVRVVINFTSAIIRCSYAERNFEFSYHMYMKMISRRLIPITFLTVGSCYMINLFINCGIELYNLVLSILVTMIISYYIGLSSKERQRIIEILQSKFKKN